MKRRTMLWLASLTCVALFVACAAIQHRQDRLSAMLKFSHKKHAAEGAGCEDCHGEVAESTGATAGKFIPNKKSCGNCHEEQVAKECGFCHLGSDRKIKLTRLDRHLHFSHAAHSKRAKDCNACHPRAALATSPGTPLVPDMDGCVKACHEKDMQAQRCDKCHQDLQRYPVKPVAQLGHQGNFLKRHGSLARDATRCASCHDQTHCSDCHARTAAMPISVRFPERIESRFIHRGDFLGRHPSAARADPTSCRKCHGANHCKSCHQLQGLVASTDSTITTATRSPHGSDWLTPGAADFHGRRALRDISSCASCHDQGSASNCVECHKVGGLGGNPHRKSFKWRNKSSECRTNSMCATCHPAGSGCP